jgi:hypothetical protein
MTNLRTAFFGVIRERRAALENEARPSPIVREITPPGVLYEYVLYVGNFLLENDVITEKDMNLAKGLVEDYVDRLGTLFPGS